MSQIIYFHFGQILTHIFAQEADTKIMQVQESTQYSLDCKMKTYSSIYTFSISCRVYKSSSNQQSSITTSVFHRCLAPSVSSLTHTQRHTLSEGFGQASRNAPLHKDKVVVFNPFLLCSKKLIFSHVKPRLRNTRKERGVFIETALTCNLFFQLLI